MLQGNMKALALENLMLKIYFICYYPIGLPITLVLCFYFQLYTKGLWLGFTWSLIMVSVCFIWVLNGVDYYKQIAAVRKLQKKAADLAGFGNGKDESDADVDGIGYSHYKEIEYNPENPVMGGLKEALI